MSGAIAAEIEVIMQTLLEMSLSGAVMIGVIIIVRALAVNRLPKTAFLALWGAAFCCLILPMRIPSPISVYSAIRRRGDFPMPVRNWQRTGLLLTGNVAREASVPSLSPWLLLWIGGAVLLALIFLILHLRGRRVYAASLPVEQPFAKSWIEEHRLSLIHISNQDGSINEEYCIYCYKDGAFVDDCTMDEMIEGSVRHMKESGMLKEQNKTEEEAREFMYSFFPELKRWK